MSDLGQIFFTAVSIGGSDVRRAFRSADTASGPVGRESLAKDQPIMNTLLITTQVVAYGVGIVSASFNIAVFVRRRRAARRRRLAMRVRAALSGA
jgi:hypothetical protein